MKPLSDQWIAKAEGDYTVAVREFAVADPICDAVCFDAQQCVGKYLKAWLTEQHIEFPRSHDLEDPARRTGGSLPTLAAHGEDLILLTSAAVETRYPGLSNEFEDTEQVVKAIHAVRILIRSALDLPLDLSA